MHLWLQKRDGQIVYNLSPELVPAAVHKALAPLLKVAPPAPSGKPWGQQPTTQPAPPAAAGATSEK